MLTTWGRLMQASAPDLLVAICYELASTAAELFEGADLMRGRTPGIKFDQRRRTLVHVAASVNSGIRATATHGNARSAAALSTAQDPFSDPRTEPNEGSARWSSGAFRLPTTRGLELPPWASGAFRLIRTSGLPQTRPASESSNGGSCKPTYSPLTSGENHERPLGTSNTDTTSVPDLTVARERRLIGWTPYEEGEPVIVSPVPRQNHPSSDSTRSQARKGKVDASPLFENTVCGDDGEGKTHDDTDDGSPMFSSEGDPNDAGSVMLSSGGSRAMISSGGSSSVADSDDSVEEEFDVGAGLWRLNRLNSDVGNTAQSNIGGGETGQSESETPKMIMKLPDDFGFPRPVVLVDDDWGKQAEVGDGGQVRTADG